MQIVLEYFFWKVKTSGELKKLYEISELSKEDKNFILKRLKGIPDNTRLLSATVSQGRVVFKDSKVKFGFRNFRESDVFSFNGKPLKITGNMSFQDAIKTIEKHLGDLNKKSASRDESEFEK